jgi:hypothetical protein
MIEWLSLVDGACNSKFNHIKVPGELYWKKVLSALVGLGLAVTMCS